MKRKNQAVNSKEGNKGIFVENLDIAKYNYYIRKILIYILSAMIIVGSVLVCICLITNMWGKDIQDIFVFTLIAVFLLILVIKNKNLLLLSNDYKKERWKK